jgi:lipopolysaccharide export system permease protein
VNDYLLPAGISSYYNLRRTILASNPAVELESNSVKKTNDSTIVIGTVDEKKVSDLLFFDVDAGKNPRIIISGAADVSTPEDKNVMLQLNMSDVLIFSSAVNKTGDYDVLTSDKVNMNVFTAAIMPKPPFRSANEYTSLGLWEEIKDMRQQESANLRSLNMYILELHRKFSQPFASIFFAFLALPLAIVFGKQNGQTIGLIIGLFLSFVFWAMIIVGQNLSIRNGFNPTMTMWAPDALMLTLAVIFFFRLKKQ